MHSVTLNLFREMLSMHPLPSKIGDVREFKHSPRCSVCICLCVWAGKAAVCVRGSAVFLRGIFLMLSASPPFDVSAFIVYFNGFFAVPVAIFLIHHHRLCPVTGFFPSGPLTMAENWFDCCGCSVWCWEGFHLVMSLLYFTWRKLKCLFCIPDLAFLG